MRTGLVALTLLAFVTTACTQEHSVRIENQTDVRLTVSFLKGNFTVDPGHTLETATREEFMPTTVTATDDQGNVRFSENLTWDKLKRDNFRVVINQ